MGNLSPHFSREEFDCHDGTEANPHPLLIQYLEVLRALCGNRPLEIRSGYRTVSWNRKVGGAKRSQHLQNRAADIPYGYATVNQARHAGFTGVGISRRKWATHVDVREGPYTTWHY